MDVVDGLAAVLAGVDHGAIALRQSFGAGNLRGCPMKMADEGVVFLAGMGNRRDVFAWNDKDVYGRLRIDVGEGVALVVLVDGFGRDTSVDDPAEEAAHCGFSLHEPVPAFRFLPHCESVCSGWGQDDCGHAGLRSGLSRAPLASHGFFSGIEEAVNCVRQVAVEATQRIERHIYEPMFATSLHQLSDASLMIYLHDNK